MRCIVPDEITVHCSNSMPLHTRGKERENGIYTNFISKNYFLANNRVSFGFLSDGQLPFTGE